MGVGRGSRSVKEAREVDCFFRAQAAEAMRIMTTTAMVIRMRHPAKAERGGWF